MSQSIDLAEFSVSYCQERNMSRDDMIALLAGIRIWTDADWAEDDPTVEATYLIDSIIKRRQFCKHS